jgi:nitrogen fixation/metabolism regulation signal transduction histidine kinase
VSLRARFLAYLVVLHLLLAALAAWLITTNRLWLFAAELVFVVSFSVGLMLVRSFARSLEFVRDSAQLLEDSDFMSRVREVGQRDIDRLIRVYNRMVGSLRDERVRLEEQHQFLARVLRESPGGILVLDFDRRVEMINPAAARLLQTRGTDIVGLALAEIDRPLAAQLDGLTAGESHVVSIWGGRRVRAAHGTFVDRGFRRSFYLLEELTEELRQSEKAAYEKLIRMLSHEVNNTVGASNSLLNSCLSYAAQLAPDDRPDFERAIGVVIGRTAQLNDFMRSFADVVRLRTPVRREVDLGELVTGVSALAQAQADSRGIAVRVEIESGLAPVSVDRAQIEQALLNIAKNGIEAIGRDGRLTFRLFARDDSRVLEIEDTGPGIPPPTRDQLFTPFFSTKEGGQGIGLTLVQEILVNHDLDYALEAPPGGPTRFTIVFAV